MEEIAMDYKITFHPKAKASLIDLYAYYAEKAGTEIAEKLVSDLHAYCDGLNRFPYRGTRRDDLYPGLRTIGYRRRAIITFIVKDDEQKVVIQGIYYGGRDFEHDVEIDDGDV
jgi:plasmid stabilization system protein ParE